MAPKKELKFQQNNAVLWSKNSPEEFWQCDPEISSKDWLLAVQNAASLLGPFGIGKTQEDLLALTLGEGRFGDEHWKLSQAKKLYYMLKPLLPRNLTNTARRLISNPRRNEHRPNWPIDPRYALFQWESLRQLILLTGNKPIKFKSLWPENHQFALVLTHDIETASGQAFVREIADLEENMGFRSSFNFVLERYPLNIDLMHELYDRGFEIGCHGLKHDGKLFNSRTIFGQRAAILNAEMKKYGMVGFRSPLTLRNPEWMQSLTIEYDLSFFDTDPFEPMPGGVMSIWPYFLGGFVELPYTLVQDNTLTTVLGETSPRLWLDKIDFIRSYHGMALLNSHPDYLKNENLFNIYSEFLNSMKLVSGYWHTIPKEIARWWKARAEPSSGGSLSGAYKNTIALVDDKIQLL